MHVSFRQINVFESWILNLPCFWKTSIYFRWQLMFIWYRYLSGFRVVELDFNSITTEWRSNRYWQSWNQLMPQSHPTTGPVRFLSPVRFLAHKAEWSARRNFTSVLFSWSHQATGPVRLDTAVHLWFGRMIRRTPRVPRAMPVRASCGPRTGIFNTFRILRDPYGARTGPARVHPCGQVRQLTQPELAKIPHGCRIWSYGARTGCSRADYNIKPRTGPVNL